MSEYLDIQKLLDEEQHRQENEICLIASENYMSENVMNACGSVFINKYAEGYSNKRYYGGCSVVDKLEDKANELARRLFNCKWSNVQPNSGCQANQAVYMALLKPNDTVLGMGINEGGHISHTLSIGFAGTFYNNISYGLDDNGYINYDEIEEKLYQYHPKLLIVGASAYPRIIDFERIRKIVDEYNKDKPLTVEKENVDIENRSIYNWTETIDKCYLMVDMAHIAGLVATGLHPSPLPYADVVTSTVQKTLRSGRGGLILSNNEELGKQIDKAIFPRLQGGPLMNMIAGKAIGFDEALQPEFKQYQEQVLANIKAMESVFKERGVKMISGGSDNHLILLDLRDKGISGQQLENALSEIGIVVNKNAVKDDPRPKAETSGIRIGTAAITTRGANEKGCSFIAHQICHMIDILTDEYDYEGIELYKTIFEQQCEKELTFKEVILGMMRENVENFCYHHPIYPKRKTEESDDKTFSE